MSIYIKGMDMPRDCPFCPMAHWNTRGDFTGCEIIAGKRFIMTSDNDYANSTTRPAWCPLTEIPEPHGRLIDADVLAKQCKPRGIADEIWEESNEYKRITNAQTIIERSET